MTQAPRSPWSSGTLRRVDDAEPEQQRAAWERRQKKLRRAQDVGLLVLTLGVLVLVYVALVASGR